MALDSSLLQAIANNGIALVMLLLLLLSIRSFVVFVAPIVQKRMENDLLLITATNDMLKEIVPVLKDIRMLCEILAQHSIVIQDKGVGKQ